MQITNENKIHFFNLVAWYFLPLVLAHFVTSFLSHLVESSFLPSQKEEIAYLITSQFVLVMRMLLALLAYVLYIDKGHPPFKTHLRKENLLIGFAFGAVLTGFFFLTTWIGPGFTLVPGQGFHFVWEVFLFRYLPLFMFYGIGLQILLGDKHSVWKQVVIATALQMIWSASVQAYEWSSGSLFDGSALYPMTTVILAISLMKKFGIYSGAACLFVNALAYQLILLTGKFPLPSHKVSFLTIIFMLALIQVIQVLQFRPGLLQAIRSRLIVARSSRPKLD